MNLEDMFAEMMRKKRYSGINKYQEENIMADVKSRYEVIAELEAKKMKLIVEKNNMDQTLKQKEREVKNLERELEDAKENVKDFKDKMKENKETSEELIKSIDESLKRFTELMKK